MGGPEAPNPANRQTLIPIPEAQGRSPLGLGTGCAVSRAASQKSEDARS
jgi:hypothetical protein